MTPEDIKAAARACIKGPVAQLSETDAHERTERLRRNGHGHPVSQVYYERHTLAAALLDSGRIPSPSE